MNSLLNDILVLDLTDEPGSFCAKLLADLGATVIKVEGPEGDPARSRNPNSFYYNNANKLAVGIDLKTREGSRTFRSLIKRADVFVETFPAGDLETLNLGWQRLHRINPRLIHISITPFGRTGPPEVLPSRQDTPCCMVFAPGAAGSAAVPADAAYYLHPAPKAPWSAVACYRLKASIDVNYGRFMRIHKGASKLAHSKGFAPGKKYAALAVPAACGRLETGVPGENFELSGCLPYYTASLFGAVAALLRLKKRKITGKGSYVDLSIHEAVASMLEREMTDYLNGGGDKDPAGRPGSESFSILRSVDGYIQIPILRNWETLLELMASRGKAGDLLKIKWQDPAYRKEHLDSIVPAVDKWTRCYTRRELLELGQAMGFPWASIDSIAEALENPQLKSRGFFVRAPLSEGGPAVSYPGLPYKFSSFSPGSGQQNTPKIPCPKSVSRCADEKMLEGLRVIDLTRMISGPYATRILADFGAEVIKIQSEKTAHGAEQNSTPSFSVWNRNKRSITLDLSLPEAREAFLKLVAGSDIVVENFSPRVMENWGLHYKHLREVKPDLVMVSISAMGHTGPWRDFVGFAPTFHALSGLISKTSGNLNPPADIDHPFADLITGLYAALAVLSALEYKDRTGEGQHIDLSALEAICTFLGPAFIESQLDSRFEIRDSRLTVTELLRGQLLDLMQDTRLAARRFFVSLKHPVLGKVVSCRTALWDWRRKPRWKASPLLGEANELIRDSRFEIRD